MSALRPTFDVDVACDAAETGRRLATLLEDGTFVGEAVGNHLMLGFHKRDRHFWSPWLTIEIEPADASARVHARFHPHPSVWTGFMLGYLGVGTATTFAAIFGFVQIVLGTFPWALPIAGAGLLLAVVMWYAAKAGQRLARHQMTVLGAQVREVLDRPSATLDA